MSKKDKFIPKWRETAPTENTFRSIFKWGDPLGFKHPNSGLYEALKENFDLDDGDFSLMRSTGDDLVTISDNQRSKLEEVHLSHFKELLGSENVSVDDYQRVFHSYGKTVEEAMELREGGSHDLVDVVLHPRDNTDVEQIVQYCDVNRIPIIPFGAGSSVNLGVSAPKGGVSLVLKTHMNKVLEINEINKSATVQAGISGPEYEDALNHAKERFGTSKNFTNGHFPQSFEFSSVGGWIVTCGAGQESSYYGDAIDLVISQSWITPRGSFKTEKFVASATGPKINDIMKGNEGSYGVLVEATLKIYHHTPETKKPFSFMFPSWEEAKAAVREISQGEFGMPGVLRLSDPEETSIGMKLYHIEGTVLDTAIKLLGYKDGERCLFIARTNGEKGFSKHVRRRAKKICRSHKGLSLTGYAVKKWDEGRYRDPYLREDLGDYGIVIDTLETSVNWDDLENIYSEVRSFVKKREKTICMTHASHMYQQGTNLYFIFCADFKTREEYKEFQRGVINAICESGGSLSHHHGVGKMIGPWMERYHGSERMDIIRMLKEHFDPNHIMNPGGQMGLD